MQTHVSTATASAQDIAELMRWLEDMRVSGPAFERLKKRLRSPYNFLHRPSVTTAQANFASLRDILHMDDRQVRSRCPVDTTAHHSPPASFKSRSRAQHGQSTPDSSTACALQGQVRVGEQP